MTSTTPKTDTSVTMSTKHPYTRIEALLQAEPQGGTIFVVGAGSSLELHDLAALDALQSRMIVCNSAYKRFPQALIAHHADYSWWKEYGDDVVQNSEVKLITGTGMGVSDESAVYPECVHKLEYVMRVGFPQLAHQIVGGNTGYQALLMAHNFKPKRIILLGIDMVGGANGATHWSGAGPQLEAERLIPLWRGAIKGFEELASHHGMWLAQVAPMDVVPEIINASPISAIQGFKKVSDITPYVAEALAELG